MARPPLAAPALWHTVMRAAGERCQCHGACGSKPDPNRRGRQQRCPRFHGEHRSKRGPITLIAAPRDLAREGAFAVAATLPAERLVAVCPDCYDGARRAVTRAARKAPAQAEGLFDAAPLYVSPASKKQADVGAA
ncbi:hypothetical protein [Streptomyces alboflavus]|uniref:hypothetical protein n=1 Tax=Streptomyces alboflavus TaxID=67267 RepID=UPI000F657D77|nr:hypothetical protein [Streptomyces alboflavus]